MTQLRRGIGLQPPAKPAKTHLIEEYKARANTIRCDCGWTGTAETFAVHRRERVAAGN